VFQGSSSPALQILLSSVLLSQLHKSALQIQFSPCSAPQFHLSSSAHLTLSRETLVQHKSPDQFSSVLSTDPLQFSSVLSPDPFRISSSSVQVSSSVFLSQLHKSALRTLLRSCSAHQLHLSGSDLRTPARIAPVQFKSPEQFGLVHPQVPLQFSSALSPDPLRKSASSVQISSPALLFLLHKSALQIMFRSCSASEFHLSRSALRTLSGNVPNQYKSPDQFSSVHSPDPLQFSSVLSPDPLWKGSNSVQIPSSVVLVQIHQLALQI
jgi:hypothetical protein